MIRLKAAKPQLRLCLKALLRPSVANSDSLGCLLRRRYHIKPSVSASTRYTKTILGISKLNIPNLAHRFTTESKTTTNMAADSRGEPNIILSADEARVLDILRDAAEDASKSRDPNDPVVLRITGGWVRDKLLCGVSNDIDIGINNMTGFDFASHLTKFLNENLERYNIPARSVHKIESNPEKSKHLETATTKILGMDIDFSNLRSETYSEESRIPQMEFGSPEQDALRRDACVNSLFYNLKENKVEDLTGRGLQDMHDRIIRTPLPPFQTFKDDPLRVLRLVRFATRLEFTIVPEVEEAMQDPEIKEALRKKITRERVGTEIEKMLHGAHPYESVSMIERLNLADCIFDSPDEKPRGEFAGVKSERFKVAIDITRLLFDELSQAEYPGISSLVVDIRDKYIIWIYCAVTPWTGIQFERDKKKGVLGPASAARAGLKLSNKDFESVHRCYANLEAAKSMVAGAADAKRSEVGNFIRRCGSEWRLQVFATLVMELLEGNKAGVAVKAFGSSEETKVVLNKYEDFLRRVEELGVADSWDWKPIVTGTELQAALGRKPGKWLKPVLDEVMDWQLDHPEGTKEDVVEYIKQNIKD